MSKAFFIEAFKGGKRVHNFRVARAEFAVDHFLRMQDDVDACALDEIKLFSGGFTTENPMVLRNSYTREHGLKRHECARGLIRMYVPHRKKVDNGSD